MRKILLSGMTAAGLCAAGALMPGSAGAMTISTPAAVGMAVENNVTDVAYGCYRRWTRWGWRRVCHRRPYAAYGYYGGYGYYGYAAPYAYYGYRRPYYRHNYYRRYW
jgi:hypothetical protein